MELIIIFIMSSLAAYIFGFNLGRRYEKERGLRYVIQKATREANEEVIILDKDELDNEKPG